jgi:hypothetical protein
MRCPSEEWSLCPRRGCLRFTQSDIKSAPGRPRSHDETSAAGAHLPTGSRKSAFAQGVTSGACGVRFVEAGLTWVPARAPSPWSLTGSAALLPTPSPSSSSSTNSAPAFRTNFPKGHCVTHVGTEGDGPVFAASGTVRCSLSDIAPRSCPSMVALSADDILCDSMTKSCLASVPRIQVVWQSPDSRSSRMGQIA